MKNLETKKNELDLLGFSVIDKVYDEAEIQNITDFISNLDTSNPIFRKSKDLFAIRQFLKEVPQITDLIFNENLIEIIKLVGGEDYFVVKSIYLDKPEKSNWFVA